MVKIWGMTDAPI